MIGFFHGDVDQDGSEYPGLWSAPCQHGLDKRSDEPRRFAKLGGSTGLSERKSPHINAME